MVRFLVSDVTLYLNEQPRLTEAELRHAHVAVTNACRGRRMCKVRCWRWLFGNKIPISLWEQALVEPHGRRACSMKAVGSTELRRCPKP